jgi:hypothetical protein
MAYAKQDMGFDEKESTGVSTTCPQLKIVLKSPRKPREITDPGALGRTWNTDCKPQIPVMKKATVLIVALALTTPVSAAAQTGIRPPRGFSLGFMGGAAAFSDLQRGSVRVFRPTSVGMEERELARRLSAETSTTLGGYLAYWPSRHWGLRLNGTFSPTRFETLMKESEAEYAGMPQSSEEGARLAGLSIITADIQGMFRLPTIKNRVLLYGIVGGGVARYQVEGAEGTLPEEVQGEFEDGRKIRPAGVFGIGSMLPMRNRALRLHFELTNHLGATPVHGGDPQQTTTRDAEVEIVPRDEPAGERRVSMTSSVRFMVGVSYSPRH